MSTIEVNKITPVSGGTTVQVGESGDTINIPAGATIANAGTATGFGVSLANGADNRVVTASSASALNGEANLTFDGTNLGVGITTPDTSTYFGKVIHVADGSNAGIMFNRTNSTAAKWSIGCNSAANLDFVKESAVKMRVDSSGRVFVNTTSEITGEGVLQVKGNSSQNVSAFQVATNGNVAIRFFNASTSGVGSITVNSSSTSYGTSSDYRLKENKVVISDGIERLKQLKPYKFNFKTEPDTTVDGFFAHEVSSIVPEAITGTKDEVEKNEDGTNKLDDDGNTIPKHQEIDQSKLVPLLTSALQEAITKIETLEARVQTLENA